MRFVDRDDAGRRLAAVLEHLREQRPVVVGLTRGGVPVGAHVAAALAAPLTALSPRKVGHPWQSEYAIAAVCEDGPLVEGSEDLGRFDTGWLEAAVANERREAGRRREAYGGPRLEATVRGRTAIVVDDGLATGLTMRAALAAVRAAGAARTVVAVPVAPDTTVAELEREADEVVVAHVPKRFQGAIGFYYERFGQVPDDEVVRLLEEAQRAERARASSATSSS